MHWCTTALPRVRLKCTCTFPWSWHSFLLHSHTSHYFCVIWSFHSNQRCFSGTLHSPNKGTKTSPEINQLTKNFDRAVFSGMPESMGYIPMYWAHNIRPLPAFSLLQPAMDKNLFYTSNVWDCFPLLSGLPILGIEMPLSFLLQKPSEMFLSGIR